MKRLNTTYWIITGLFSAFMIFSSIGGITLDPQAVEMLHDHLGYPIYFIQWLSVIKLIGAIAILLPMVPANVKEWAYFGFFLDLVHRGRRSGLWLGADALVRCGAGCCLCGTPQAKSPADCALICTQAVTLEHGPTRRPTTAECRKYSCA